ncbi:MAG: carboxypeptidase regulatory-like domain-containing protein [Candidatus Zixiibacteriota bacterium]
MRLLRSIVALIIVQVLFVCTTVQSGDQSSSIPVTGSIKGSVVDAVTQAPVAGASVIVVGTKWGAAAGAGGEFTIGNIPVGGYAVTVGSVSYEPVTLTDVIVRSDRITHIEVELLRATIEIQGAVVTAGYFSQKTDKSNSTLDFNSGTE